ncbi:hypothetical protein CCO02nite_03410 [Cellulomonas composti]|uniref:DUF222 domain-containing protein n=1 Tax=Cellulomonas composti TaxID=266130 RepID=A0A511J7I9_9CELL|nr:hypothetical protein CCO02nite_03410 [Cellulomonas composti]
MASAWPDGSVAYPREGADVPTLVGSLGGRNVSSASDTDLLAMVVGWQQVIGGAMAEQATLVRELGARRLGGVMSALPAELAAALALTTTTAESLLVRAESLAEHPALDRALRDGRIDARKIDIVIDEVASLTPASDWDGDRESRAETVSRIVEAAATFACGLTTTKLRRFVRREVLAADPASAEKRAVAEVAKRHVSIDWKPDSMAWVSAYLPAQDAMVLRAVLDAAADATSADDPRTKDQRRADTFTSIFATIAETGLLPCGSPLPARHRVRPHIEVTVAAETLLGLDDAPAYLSGYGPIPAGLARQIAADGTWRRVLTDGRNGPLLERGRTTYRPGADLTGTVIARDRTCTFPGCAQPAGASELDHIEPFDARTGRGPTTLTNLHAACKRHHDLKTEGRWRVRRDARSGAVVWTSAGGITYAMHPQSVLAAPEAVRGEHGGEFRRPPALAPPDEPPF